MAIGGVHTVGLAEMASGMVKTVLARLVMFMFLMEKLGVTVMGFGPLMTVVGIEGASFLPRVLRSTIPGLAVPPNKIGGIVGMVGESMGSATG